MESKQANNVKDTADSKEGPTCVIDEIPTEIIMITVKMLPNFEDRMAFGLTSRRYWDIMIQSRSPEDPCLQLVENHTLAREVLNWVETRGFVSYIGVGIVWVHL